MRMASPWPSLLGLGGIDDDLVQISSLDVFAIVETTNGDGVGAVLKGQLDRSGEQDALVGVLLEEGVHVILVTVDNDAANATKLPGAVDAVRLSHSYGGRQVSRGSKREHLKDNLRWSPKPMSSMSVCIRPG